MFVVSCGTGYGSVYTVTCIQDPGSCMPYTVAYTVYVYVHNVHVHIIEDVPKHVGPNLVFADDDQPVI